MQKIAWCILLSTIYAAFIRVFLDPLNLLKLYAIIS